MESFLKALDLPRLEAPAVAALPPAVLAYVGDAVYETYIRVWSAYLEQGAILKHHRRTVGQVKASAQVEMLKRLEPMLTDMEREMVRRGRNAKSGSVPKNAAVGEYRLATGFEAMIGYLYLSGEVARVEALIAAGLAPREATDGTV